MAYGEKSLDFYSATEIGTALMARPAAIPDNKSATPTRLAESSSATIVRDIVRGLYEGRYVPGQRLAEPDLIAYYGVSRSTVREAIKQMATDGIVVSNAFKGAQIRKLTHHEAANLFSIAEVILGLAARQAAVNIGAGDGRKRLRQCFSAIAAHKDEGDRFEFLRQRNRYFRILIEIGRNDEIMRILPRLQVHLIRNRLAVPRSERVEGYRLITEAILAKNGDAAEAMARRYVSKTASYVLPLFPN